MTPIVKICGLSTAATLEAALAAGADMVGFVFFPKSPRHVGYETARALGAQARGRARIVALSVDADDDALGRIIEALSPDLLQLHGRETPSRVREIRQRFGRPTIKAIGVAAPEDFAAAAPYDGVADFLLIDAKPPRDAVLPGRQRARLRLAPRPAAFLRGGHGCSRAGSTPDNVAEAIAQNRRARGRRVVGRRERPGREGRDEDQGVHRRRARARLRARPKELE